VGHRRQYRRLIPDRWGRHTIALGQVSGRSSIRPTTTPPCTRCPPTPTRCSALTPMTMVDDLGVVDADVFEAMCLASVKRA
jgi:hypothetical protein